MKFKDLAGVSENPTLLQLFAIAIRRAALTILMNPQSTVSQLDWAKRACFTFKDDRTFFYARLVIDGSLIENTDFRNLIGSALESSNAGDAQLPDAAFVSLVTTWVTRFAAADI